MGLHRIHVICALGIAVRLPEKIEFLGQRYSVRAQNDATLGHGQTLDTKEVHFFVT
jgi:hypothetical protein